MKDILNLALLRLVPAGRVAGRRLIAPASSRRAANGSLVWKFLAAGQERQLFAYGQLESVHPVHGSVLIQNNTRTKYHP